MTRSPGKNVVYLGSLLLVIGIILMFYVREVRVWLLLQRDGTRLAMTSNRHNRDLDQDFERMVDYLNKQAGEA
jgi:cytochrome c biogenesis protein